MSRYRMVRRWALRLMVAAYLVLYVQDNTAAWDTPTGGHGLVVWTTFGTCIGLEQEGAAITLRLEVQGSCQ